MCTTGAIAGGAGFDSCSNFAHSVAAATTSAAAAIPALRAASAASSSPQRALSYFVGAVTSPNAGRADRGNARFCGSTRATSHQITSAATSFRCQALSLSQLRIGSSRDSSGMTSRYAAASASGTVAGSSTNDSSGAGVGGGGGGAPMPKPGSAWMDRTVRVPGSVPNPTGPLAGRSFILKDIYDVRICSACYMRLVGCSTDVLVCMEAARRPGPCMCGISFYQHCDDCVAPLLAGSGLLSPFIPAATSAICLPGEPANWPLLFSSSSSSTAMYYKQLQYAYSLPLRNLCISRIFTALFVTSQINLPCSLFII